MQPGNGPKIELVSNLKESIMINSLIYTEGEINERSISVAYIAALKAAGEEYEDYYKSVLWVE